MILGLSCCAIDRSAGERKPARAGQASLLETTLERERASVEAVHSRLSVWRGLIDPRVLFLCFAYFAFGSTSYCWLFRRSSSRVGMSNFLVG